LRNLISVSLSLAMLFCLSVTMLGADSFVDSQNNIVCVADYDYAPSVDIVDNPVPAPSDVVFIAESPTLDVHAEVPSDAELTTYTKTKITKTKRNRNRNRGKSKAKRSRSRSANSLKFPGQSRSGKSFKGCAWSN